MKIRNLTLTETETRALSEKRHEDPSYSQTEADIGAYYQNANVGDHAAVRQTQGGFLQFLVTKIDGINTKRGRIYVADSPTWGGRAYYRKSGKSCFAPTGQTRLVVPTPEVIAWTIANPDGLSMRVYFDGFAVRAE